VSAIVQPRASAGTDASRRVMDRRVIPVPSLAFSGSGLDPLTYETPPPGGASK